ncbi:MAG: hypothetical protein NUV77_16330, partial [Thermoguttaceae bacterium]|nr:hypothetical protein [Thermoguttaceae bacterium]
MPSAELSRDEPVELVVAPEEAGWRLDVFLAHHLPEYSRVHLRRVITAGGVRILNLQKREPTLEDVFVDLV